MRQNTAVIVDGLLQQAFLDGFVRDASFPIAQSKSPMQINLANREFTCPCCGYRSFGSPPGSYELCEISCWEDDAVQLAFPFSPGANNPLIEEQKRWASRPYKFEQGKSWGREPVEGDLLDSEWRPYDPDVDGLKDGPKDGRSYFDALSEVDEIQYPYYWRRDSGPSEFANER